MKSVLVTGCAGFIGSHLTERLLDEGFRVFGIDNFDAFYSKELKQENLKNFLNHPSFSFKELDINKKESFNLLSKVDIVCHMAAKAGVRPSIMAPSEYIETNICGTHNILEWMREKEISKLIFASSSSVYGNNESIPFSETDNVDNPISPYAFTKKSCELLNYTYHHLYGFSIINLRFFTVFGPRQRPDLAINKFVSRIQENKEIEIFGDGETARDYTYISDIVDGIYNSIVLISNRSAIYEIVNLGNQNPIKLRDLVATIESILNKKAKIVFKPIQDGDVNLTFANIEQAGNLINYRPKVSIKDGITNFILWKKTS